MIGYRDFMSERNFPIGSEDGTGILNGTIDDEPVSAGETGDAALTDDSARDTGVEEVIIGEIPDTSDLAHMLWTARCTNPAHGLLGTYESRELAEQAKERHLHDPQGHQA
jgi:hypothetical protein